MNDIRKLIESLEKIEEGAFSELDITLDEFKAKHPEATPVQIVAHVRRVHGNDAAKYMSDQFEREGDKADWLGEGFEQSYDDFVQEMKHSLIHKIVSYGVFEEMIKAAGSPQELEDAVMDEAYSVADSYHGTGEGIGTSDMNHFVQSIGRSLGIENVLGWNLKKEGIEEEGELKSDEEMERDKTNRYSKYNAAIRRQQGLEEAKGEVVQVPDALSNPDPKNPKATSDDAEKFIAALGPDDEVDDYVVDPETGEVLFEPFMTKRSEGMDKFKSAREYHDNKETWVPSIYGASNQDDAWEELGDLKAGNNGAARFYNIVWRGLDELLGDPRDTGSDAESWGELDYDTGYEVPVAIKRKDGKKMQEEDYENFRELAKLIKLSTGNISLSMMGTTDKGTVVRFTPTLM